MTIGRLFACAALVAMVSPLTSMAAVRINEVHYHPPSPHAKTLEFVELLNDGDSPVSLVGWRLSGGVDFDFASPVTLAPGAFIVVGRDRTALIDELGLPGESVLGDFEGALDNDGDTITLLDAENAYVDHIDFDDRAPWPEEADGDGASLQRVCPSAPSERASSWIGDSEDLPTPLAENAGLACPPPSSVPPHIVINEIHYHPGADREQLDEFIELHNTGDAAVDVGGWRVDGIGFVIPDGTTIGPGGYLAVCRNAAHIALTFGVVNVVGDFSGKIANAGERLALVDLVGETVDAVVYRDRDDWPHSADGGGHSLEKIRPLAESSDAASWAASRIVSDEWMTFRAVGPLNSLSRQVVGMSINGVGELIVDDIVLEAIDNPGVNLVENGDFEAGLGSWRARGTASGSTVEDGIGFGGGAGLRLVTTGPCGDDCASCGSSNGVSFTFRPGEEVDLEAEYRLTVRLRHISGSAAVYCRVLRGATVCLGEFLASPGLENGVRSDVQPPFVSHRGRFPLQPRAQDVIGVSARVRMPTGQDLESVELAYIVDSGDPVTISMADDGQSGDGAAGDGVFGVELPEVFDHHTVVLYRITARSSDGLVAVAPHTLAPQEERPADFWGVYVNDEQPDSELPTYNLILPGVSPDDPLSINALLDCEVLDSVTFAYDGEVYPDCRVRFRGNTACALKKRNLKFRFNRGRFFQGIRKMNLQGIWTDKSLVREHLAWDLVRQIGLPYCETEFVRVHINGGYHGLFLYLEHPDGRFLERNGLDGDDCLYKAKQPVVDGTPIGVMEQSTLAAYGQFWEQETCEDRDLGALADFIDSLHADSRRADGPTAEFFVERTIPEHVIGYQIVQAMLNNIDSFAKNHFLYQDADSGKWSVLCWDLDLVLGKFFNPDVAPVGTLNDCMLSPNRLELNPWFTSTVNGNAQYHYFVDFFFNAGDGFYQRAYLVRLWDLLEEKYRNEVYDPIIDELADSLGQEQAEDFERWGRSAVSCGNGCTEICANEITMAANVEEVKRQIRLHRSFLADYIERRHPEIPAHDRMKITELMYHPVDGGAGIEYIELVNTSGREIDISEWAITGGVTFVFPRGTTVPGDGTVLVVQSEEAFLALYPDVEALAQVFGDFQGGLSNSGEELRLVDDGQESSTHPATIDYLVYGDGGVWPDVTPGHSIELTDVSATRDNDFGENWRQSASALGTPGETPRFFVRGDAAVDGDVNLSDAVKILGYLFLQDASVTCLDAADADDDGAVLLTDAMYVLNYLFRGGAPPPSPFPEPGDDTSEDELACP